MKNVDKIWVNDVLNALNDFEDKNYQQYVNRYVFYDSKIIVDYSDVLEIRNILRLTDKYNNTHINLNVGWNAEFFTYK